MSCCCCLVALMTVVRCALSLAGRCWKMAGLGGETIFYPELNRHNVPKWGARGQWQGQGPERHMR
jgi:hypothetical protein